MFMFRSMVGAALALTGAVAAAQAPDVNLARNLAATCANCHGTNGQAQGAAVKSLAGLPAANIVGLMAAYKSGAGNPTIMHQISKGYTDEQIRLIAEYFAAQKPAR